MRKTRHLKTLVATAAALTVGLAGLAGDPVSAQSTGTGSGSSGSGGTTPGSSGATGGTAGSMSSGAGSGGMRQGAANVSRGDRRFMEKAAMANRAEIELGRLAQQRASSPQVKSYAERMVQEHTQAGEEMARLASARGVTMPTELDRAHRRKAEKLAEKQGADFDRDYMKGMVDDHEDTVEDFRKASRNADDPEVKAFAARMLPNLEQHLQMARAANEQLRSAQR